ncbi:MAG: RluA family pseudouridine synthase [Clostridia bacterium]|nr:RluA family pseudouridine synthase [Clostridia bacterium]
MRVISYRVNEADAGRSVAAILRGGLGLSGGLIARLKRTGGITKNGAPVKANECVEVGDTVAAAVGESPAETGRAALSFPILFEDEDILIIDKPAGVAVHGSRYADADISVESAVNAYYGKTGLFHPVNRLDRGTSGAMLIAKNGYMHEKAASLLHTGDFERVYLGVAEGIFAEKSGRIDAPIARVGAIKRAASPFGAPAATNYRVIEENCGFSLVEYRLETGRTHQIRVHSAHIGHPLAGDFLYGTENRALISRPALHSVSVEFTHPLSTVRIRAVSKLPDDMKSIMKRG